MEKSPAFIAELRTTLLDLHKSLMDAQRVRYEKEHGRIQTPNEFLGLLLEHPTFAWLRSISALIAQLDEWIEQKAERSDAELESIMNTLRSLIATDGPPTFSQAYWEIVNDVPEVLVNHVKLWRQLQPRH
jgi:hypothetical protein